MEELRNENCQERRFETVFKKLTTKAITFQGRYRKLKIQGTEP
jgi:hypothetical protein